MGAWSIGNTLCSFDPPDLLKCMLSAASFGSCRALVIRDPKMKPRHFEHQLRTGLRSKLAVAQVTAKPKPKQDPGHWAVNVRRTNQALFPSLRLSTQRQRPLP